MMKMKVIVSAVLVLFMAVIASARPLSSLYSVIGRVYCDTCRVGFETPLTSYIAGAKVKVECRNRDSQKVLFTIEGTTNSTGSFKIPVNEDQGNRICDVVLISSPMHGCKKPDPGRDHSRISLTAYNGLASKQRYANALGFVQDYSLSACTTQLLKQYQLEGDENPTNYM